MDFRALVDYADGSAGEEAGRIVRMPGGRDTISLVIPNYNGVKYLERLLAAVRAQERPADELIIVDDASTDDSVAYLRKHAPEARLIEREVNGGFVAAVNTGIAAATGTLIALLNNDTEPQPAWLGALERELSAHPEAGSAASKMLFRDTPEIVNSTGIGCTDYGMVYDIGYGCPDGPAYADARAVLGASAGAALYRRGMLDAVGPFDAALVMWYEDVDLSFRAQLLGYQCRYAPDAVVLHVGGGTIPHRSARANFYCARNQAVVWMKNLPGDLLARLLPRALWLYVKHSLKMLLTKGDPVPLVAYCAVLPLLPHILRERRRLHGRRTISSAALRGLFVSRAVADTQVRIP